ncbi:MAG: prolipoprotein diacylglyceryl transferase [Erysipelotrichales bacterium]|nr:prolipoprotein diacylglyceryl transferase [Erysipelotrichales bacterium]
MKLAGIILLLVSVVGFFFLLNYKRKGKLEQLTNKHILIIAGVSAAVSFVSLMLAAFGIRNESGISLSAGRAVFIVSMSLLLTLDLYYFVMAIWHRKYVLDEENFKKLRKILYITSIISGVMLIAFVTLYLESIAPFLSYPFNKLIIDFGKEKGVTYYAVFIIIGALTTYFISDYFVAKAGYGHGKLENCLYLAFPAGIVGGRIWYVIAEWEKEFAGYEFSKVFRIWEGGLAIQGGVILGAAVGIAYMMWKHKDIPIMFLIDTIVPGILLAQAIGRWGNFMNVEVYGAPVSVNSFPWLMLPTWVKNQMLLDNDPTKMYMPLFLIEGIFNVAGYFLIAYGVGRGLKKYLVPGDQGLLYLVVYGFIRFFLEPLRDPKFIMGSDSVMKSKIMAVVFIVAGILGIVALHVIDYLKKKKKNEQAAA